MSGGGLMTVEQRNLETELRDLASERGGKMRHLGDGHYQIVGRLLVNYYPFSKKATAYVANTTCGKHQVTPAQAVAMAYEPPAIATADKKDSRGNQGKYRRWKRRMYKAGFRDCHWCREPVTLVAGNPNFATVDHRIPLHRGGLDNPNNWVIAHLKCNSARGHDMPELKVAGDA